ncbi:MAG TPA: MFS transporter [Propionibacteriaceae bacterium]|nr:MFS transporter [Propionibacteriaceae bacterium]
MPRLLADTAPLANQHFRRLWFANIVTVIGAQLTVVAVPAQIYAITQSSGYVGLAGLFGLVPLVIFGLYGGALADHLDKRRLMIITTLGIIATSALFFVQALLGNANVWLLLTIFALQQAFFAVNQPTRTSLLPQILGRVELLPAANSLNMTVFAGGAIAGPLVAGALIPVLGYPWLYAIDTLTLTATLYAVWRLPALPASGMPTGRAPGFGAVVDGFRYLAGHRVVLLSFVVDIIAMVFGMPRALFPAIAHLDFGGPQTGGMAFALLYAAIPAGTLVGGVFSGWVSKVTRHGRATILAIVTWGLAVTVFGACAWLAHGRVSPWLWLGFVAMAVAGAADMTSSAFRQTILQSVQAENIRGRLQGVFIVVVGGGPRVADVLHGGAAAVWGNPQVTIAGGVLVIVGVLLAVAAVPAFWRYRGVEDAASA